MDPNGSEESDSLDWNTEDELEIQETSVSASRIPGQEVNRGSGETSSSSGSSNSKVISHFVGMGFPQIMVVKAIEENGEDNIEAILETLLTYSALENSPREPPPASTDPCSFDSASNSLDDVSDVDSSPGNEGNKDHLSEKDKMLSLLVDMGYLADEALMAIDTCGLDSPIAELTDFMCAAQMAKEADAHFREFSHEDDGDAHLRELFPEDVTSYSHARPRNDYFPRDKKRKLNKDERQKSRRHIRSEKKQTDEDEDMLNLPNPMVGFGLPNEPWPMVHRTLPEDATGPPYFYYENVALTPKGVWSKISRFLYDVEPEFVDSKFFCAAARKRGYIHNLPIHNRCPLLPIPPLTIQKALPSSKKWWPSWDSRTQFNCLLTCIGSAKLTDRIRKALEKWDDEPPPNVQKYVLEECRRWNLVWVGRNKVAPLEPDEMEMLLGYPTDHTRGISRTDRYKALGNSFQVDTVAYHLSVLKDLFPSGINVLSLFSGIGGAEVALHRLGIPLKNVVSVEISETNRNILHSWWEQTNQQGSLVEMADVQQVTAQRVEQWLSSFGGFDLVIGGSPCNNLAGGNRVSRDGLEGKQSSLFFEYIRILDLVRSMMRRYR
ncbi:hypothetical protein L1049_005928 [Liquidambar formosana]|uniref:DNA (cytosine-5-)-methyltransferase n=1 Tax=Liquidambar formosana TaxID=63359 RepID=A0AAP0RG85_LIQFO